MTTEPRDGARQEARIHWDRSATFWDILGPPLRPCQDDLDLVQRAVAEWGERRADTKTRVLLLGVTPEIAGMPWPARTDLLACDESEEMVRLVWPADPPPHRYVQRADWLRLPVADHSMDVVVGDGSFSCVDMDYPGGHERLARSVDRVLKRDGVLVARLYARPDRCDEPQDVFDDLVAGRFDTFDGFRLKLLMALQGESPSIRLDDVYRAWKAAAVDFDAVVARTGWRREVEQSILRYQGKMARYSFPTLRQVRSTLSAWFDEVSIGYPGYQLGDRCPVVVWRPRQEGA